MGRTWTNNRSGFSRRAAYAAVGDYTRAGLSAPMHNVLGAAAVDTRTIIIRGETVYDTYGNQWTKSELETFA